MDSTEIVTQQQPVSTLPDFVSGGPNTREGLLVAPVEPTSLYPTESAAFLSKPEAAVALAEEELSMSESPTNLQFQEETNKEDGNGNVAKVVDSSISAGRTPPSTAIVQQITDTVDIEVDLTALGTEEGRLHEGTVLVVSSVQQEEGHVGLLIEQADGQSNAQDITVEVVLDDVKPRVSEAQLSSLGDGGGDLEEVPASGELVAETAEVGTVEGSNNEAENCGIQHSSQAANAGYSVEIEAVVISDVNKTVSSTAIAEVDAQRGEEAEMKELEISSISGLEQVDVEIVMSDPALEEIFSIMEKGSAANLRFKEEIAIEKTQLINNSEEEIIAKPLVDNVIRSGTGNAPTAAVRTTTEEVIPVAVSEEALNATDQSTVYLNNSNAPELESAAAETTSDQRVHIAVMKESLNSSDSSVTRMVGGGSAGERETAAELDSNNFVMADGGDACAEEHSILGVSGPIAGSTSITATDELREESRGIVVVDHTGEQLLTTVKNAGSEIGDIPMTSSSGEMEELSNSVQIKINETCSVHSVETTEMLGPTEETNVETSLETATKISIQAQEDGIEGPEESTAKTETAQEETLIRTTVEKLQENTGVQSSDEKTQEQQPAITLQEMIPKVTKDGGIPLGEAMNNVISPVYTTVVRKGEDTAMVNAPAAKQEGEAVAIITKSTVLEEGGGAAIDENLIDLEVGLVGVEETIDTTVSITTTQHGNGGAAAGDVDTHGVLIGVGSSVESSGLTITEIGHNNVQVEEFRVEQQSVWVSSEPLITPPEEEIIQALGDLSAAGDDSVDEEEPPQSTESLVFVVIEDDAQKELHDLQTSLARETQTTSGTTTGTQNSQHAAQAATVVALLDTEQQTTSDTVFVDIAEPLDLQDGHSRVRTLTGPEMGTVDIAAARIIISPSLVVPPPENTDIVAEVTARGHQDEIPAITEAVDLPTEGQDVSLSIEVLSSEALSVKIAAGDGAILTPAFESHPVSISTSLCSEEKRSPIDKSATAVVEPVTRVDQASTTKADASDVVVPITTNKVGFGLAAAVVDSSEARSMDPAEGREVAPVVEVDMDSRINEQLVECALDGSAYIVVDGLETLEALDRNEKKRAREEESDAVAEDTEKIPKAAKTSNGEISSLKNFGANDGKVAEDVQVDKKRSRDELESVSANPGVSVQAKVQKTGTVDDSTVPQSRKADTDGQADAEECVDMEDKEEVQQKSVNGGAGQDSTAPRYKKRRIALFLGYSGAGYQGMQKNPGAITIEGELEEALFRAGAIAESNYGQPQKLDWRRAARTDKGVSAVGQVVSGSFFIDPPGFVDRVNSHLPKQIRVYGYKRATASFNSKKLCDRRKYEYVLPVYAFDPSVHLDRETAQALASAQSDGSLDQTEISAPAIEIETETCVVIESDMKETITEEEIIVTLVEPVGETVVDEANSVIPNIEGKDDNKSSSDGMSAVTEEVTTVTEIAQENVAAGVKVQIEETLLEKKEVTSAETVVDLSPEEKEALDEKASTAPIEVLTGTPFSVAERTEVTVPETVIDLSAEEKKEALDEKVKNSTYQFDEAELNRLNRILKGFEGHHNFHNFTARTKATDPSANRYIISFGVENTFTIDGVEFVRCSVVGQSFMLHQIRKMIGLAVAIMRGTAPESILATALRRDTKINVPLAPELGLFLEECYYSAYNRRFNATHEEMSLSSFSAEVNEFKKEFIYPHIGSTEARDSTFALWLHSLNDRHYPDFLAAKEAEKLIKSQ